MEDVAYGKRQIKKFLFQNAGQSCGGRVTLASAREGGRFGELCGSLLCDAVEFERNVVDAAPWAQRGGDD